MKALAFMFFLLLHLPAFGSNWEIVVRHDAMKIAVDTDSITASNGKTKAWTWYVYTVPEKTDGNPPKEYRSEKRLELYDCKERMTTFTQVYRYSTPESDRIIEYLNFGPEIYKFQDVMPDTIGEALFTFVCKKRRMKLN